MSNVSWVRYTLNAPLPSPLRARCIFFLLPLFLLWACCECTPSIYLVRQYPVNLGLKPLLFGHPFAYHSFHIASWFSTFSSSSFLIHPLYSLNYRVLSCCFLSPVQPSSSRPSLFFSVIYSFFEPNWGMTLATRMGFQIECCQIAFKKYNLSASRSHLISLEVTLSWCFKLKCLKQIQKCL